MAEKKKRSVKKIIATIVVTLIAVSMAGSGYMFYLAEVRGAAPFKQEPEVKPGNPLYDNDQEYKNATGQMEDWNITNKRNLKLDAKYWPADQATDKTVVVIHGFNRTKEDMAAYSSMFHNMGYNVLVADNETHGKSQGTFVGYGWLDKDNYVQWINEILKKKGNNQQIAVFGISMGGATTMMLSGEKLPDNVKVFIEDAGYDSVINELSYQAKSMFGIPQFPLVDIASIYSQVLAGYNYFEASSTKQLAKNTRPFLFIHGGKDKFVPTEMIYKNYAADKDSQKQMWVAPNSGHVQSYPEHKEEYEQKVRDFLNQYFN